MPPHRAEGRGRVAETQPAGSDPGLASPTSSGRSFELRRLGFLICKVGRETELSLGSAGEIGWPGVPALRGPWERSVGVRHRGWAWEGKGDLPSALRVLSGGGDQEGRVLGVCFGCVAPSPLQASVCSSARWAAGCLSMSRSAPWAPGEALVGEHATALWLGAARFSYGHRFLREENPISRAHPRRHPARIPSLYYLPPPPDSTLPARLCIPGPPGGPALPVHTLHRPRPASTASVRFHLPQEPVSARVPRETGPHLSFE